MYVCNLLYSTKMLFPLYAQNYLPEHHSISIVVYFPVNITANCLLAANINDFDFTVLAEIADGWTFIQRGYIVLHRRR